MQRSKVVAYNTMPERVIKLTVYEDIINQNTIMLVPCELKKSGVKARKRMCDHG